MRDRLIELFERFDYYAPCERCTKSIKMCEKCKNERYTDYLLANGVIVPPCKVGQTIYYHFQFSNKRILPFTRKAKVKKICCSNNKMKFVVDAELIDAKEKGIMKSFDFDDFGKTVFLTRQEAEQALKGGEG